MTQLKTLKDLNVILNTNYYPDKKLTNLVPIYDLKQEAIKWIKELKIRYGETWDVHLFKEFFNLTDEDLK